jgi:hypothetical protein
LAEAASSCETFGVPKHDPNSGERGERGRRPRHARGGAGPVADVWEEGVDDVLAAVRLIGYTDVVSEAPEWLSAETKGEPPPQERGRSRRHRN